jgi:hypothetical protein
MNLNSFEDVSTCILSVNQQPKPFIDCLTNKYPHLSVVLIFKEHVAVATRGAHYTDRLFPVKRLSEIIYQQSRTTPRFQARRAFYRPFKFGQEEFTSLLLFCCLAVEASRAFYRPFLFGQEGNENLFSSGAWPPLKRRCAFYRPQDSGQEKTENSFICPHSLIYIV